MSELRTSVDGSIATLTISNPERRNAITADTAVELAEAVHAYAYDDEIRCLILAGDPAGGAFCAGADLQSRSREHPDDTASTEPSYHRAVYEIMRAKKPVLAKIRGSAVGAGASIAASCDFVYAAEEAQVGWVFANIGLTLDSGASFILPRIMSVRRAMELVATGEIIDAERAVELDVFTDVLPDDELDEFVETKAEELASGPTLALGEMKRLLLRGASQSLDEALYDESRAQALMYYTEDSEEGREAFLEGRDPEFEGR